MKRYSKGRIKKIINSKNQTLKKNKNQKNKYKTKKNKIKIDKYKTLKNFVI